MDKNQILILVFGTLGVLGLLYIDIFYAFIGIVIVGILLMSAHIMRETTVFPNVDAELNENAKSIVIINKGNAEARNIHVALVPMDIEFDVRSLAVDEQFQYALPSMLAEAKAVVTFESISGGKYSRTYKLSALGKDGQDLLKPEFPLFSWK
jgi:hypothetical protein